MTITDLSKARKERSKRSAKPANAVFVHGGLEELAAAGWSIQEDADALQVSRLHGEGLSLQKLDGIENLARYCLELCAQLRAEIDPPGGNAA